MDYIVQYAKSNLTCCSKCEKSIILGEIRIAFKRNDVKTNYATNRSFGERFWCLGFANREHNEPI